MSDQLEDIPAVDNSSGANKPLFETVNLLDPRLCVQDQLDFAVEKGASNNTKHVQGASSQTTSNIQFDLTLPSLSTIIDRKMMIRGTLVFKSAPAADVAAGAMVAWGTDETFCALPFDACVENYNLTINSQSFTYQSRQLRDIILRNIDEETMLEYSSLAPVQLDKYQKLSDAKNKANGVFTDYQTESNYKSSNASFQVTIQQYSVANAPVNPLAGGPPARGTLVGDYVLVTVNICEPLYFSPCVLNTTKDGSQGMYGIQNMQLTVNLNASSVTTCKAIKSTTNTFSLSSVSNMNLEVLYLTPHASLKLPARNLIPYLDLVSYTYDCPSMGIGSNVNTCTSNSIQLNGVPDCIMFGVRQKRAGQGANSTDVWLPLSAGQDGNVSISYGNQSGYFSNDTNYSLWQRSRDNGLNITWNEFCGSAFVGGASVSTVGSLIKLNFARDGLCSQDWISSSSMSSGNLQIRMNVANNTGAAIGNDIPGGLPPNPYELVVVCVNSGFIVNSLGSTSRYVNVLDKQTVLTTSQKPPVNKGTYARVYGGGWWSSIKSGFRKAFKIGKSVVKPLASIAKPILASMPDPRAQAAAATIGALGGGISAGATKFHGRVY